MENIKDTETKSNFKKEVIDKFKQQAPQILTDLAIIGGTAALTAILEHAITKCTESDTEPEEE